MSLPVLTPFELAIAAALLLVNAAISIALRLGLERSLLIATVRMIAQLSLIGLVLRIVFAAGSPALVAAFALMMIAIATVEMTTRQPSRFKGLLTHGIAASTLLVAGTTGTTIAVTLILHAATEPVGLEARIVLPILGMVLGNALTSGSLALSTLLDLAGRDIRAIEAQLAQGATRRAAFSPIVQQTLRTALMPTLNAMSVAGVVSLPGMMTGQILAGADPLHAANYQIMILCVISGASALAAFLTVFAATSLLSDSRERLRLDRLTKTG